MTKMYYIETGNRFNQILLFKTKQAAREWMQRATRLTAREIENSIYTAISYDNTQYNIYPKEA